MSFRLVIRPLAEKDILEAYNWYNLQKDGLGDDYLNELENTLSFIELRPHQYQVRYRNIHMAKVYRFPFCVHYTIEEETVFVHAVLSTMQDPENWNKVK